MILIVITIVITIMYRIMYIIVMYSTHLNLPYVDEVHDRLQDY